MAPVARRTAPSEKRASKPFKPHQLASHHHTTSRLKSFTMNCNKTFQNQDNHSYKDVFGHLEMTLFSGKDAANYFFNEISQWREQFRAHTISTDTKKAARVIDASLNEINFMLNELFRKLNYCFNGFMLNEYLKTLKMPIVE
ncbi:MAG: hypothetical protein ACKOXZ_04300, partial [Polynucleobacter victoriensis]